MKGQEIGEPGALESMWVGVSPSSQKLQQTWEMKLWDLLIVWGPPRTQEFERLAMDIGDGQEIDGSMSRNAIHPGEE